APVDHRLEIAGDERPSRGGEGEDDFLVDQTPFDRGDGPIDRRERQQDPGFEGLDHLQDRAAAKSMPSPATRPGRIASRSQHGPISLEKARPNVTTHSTEYKITKTRVPPTRADCARSPSCTWRPGGLRVREIRGPPLSRWTVARWPGRI